MERSYLVLDIETILDPELPIAESSEAERLPAPPHHQIVVIGVLWLTDDYRAKKLGVIGEAKTEAETVADLARFLEDKRPELVTFNGRGFDLPVIAARCLRYGVPFRYYYQSRDTRYRFTPDGHLDVMDYLSDFGAAKPSRLDAVAKLCGMPGKVGIDGKDVGPLIHVGRIAEVRNYCLCDVVQTAAIFLRLQLLRGELDRDGYLTAMSGLLETVEADARVEPITHGWDKARLLLTA